MKKRAKVELDGVQGGLNAAFSQLSIPDLPPGPPTAPPAEARESLPRKMGRVVLRRETAHRGGKAVIVVHDFASHIREEEIGEIARELRTACGCGGTCHARQIELQGEQIARVRAELERRGFQVAGVR